MLSYIKGQITFKNPGFIIVETHGLGYHVNISLHTYATVEKLEQVKILVHEHIKEDSHTLYGFAAEEERHLFRHLISVSGIGPGTAQLILSTLQPAEVRSAIIGEQVQAFKTVKGIGPKTAKRLILDLKDKLLKENDGAPVTLTPANNTLREEALSALAALAFAKIPVQKALNKIVKTQPDVQKVEELIKLALRELS